MLTRIFRAGPDPGNTDRIRHLLGAAGASFLDAVEAEAERLDSLARTQLLDSPAEERFDRITRRAQRLLKVSSAVIAFIADGRQFLKSVLGPVGQNMPRNITFCDDTIRGTQPLIANDALADEKYRTSPLVTDEPHIRFYPGYPLQGPGGWNIGTFCIIDQEPSILTPARRMLSGIWPGPCSTRSTYQPDFHFPDPAAPGL
jgi:GAF domain-containing protein